MRTMINTVMLDPNRWTPKPRIPYYDIIKLLPAIRETGFTRVEMWQYHVSGKTLAEAAAIRKQADSLGIVIPVIGAYPCFRLPPGPEAQAEEAERTKILGLAGILGAARVKIMLGDRKLEKFEPGEEERTTAAVQKWFAEAKKRKIRFSIELHPNTLFDPCEAGEAFLAAHPELRAGICYQPYDFKNHEAAMLLADRFRGRIDHVHLQGQDAEGRAPLDRSAINYRILLPKLARETPGVTFGVEFVKECFSKTPEGFDLDATLLAAKRDAEFVEQVLGQG